MMWRLLIFNMAEEFDNLSEREIRHRLYFDCWDGEDIREFIKVVGEDIDKLGVVGSGDVHMILKKRAGKKVK